MKPSRAKVEVNDALQVTLSQGASQLAIQLDREHARALGVALIEYAGREAPLRGAPLRGLLGSARSTRSKAGGVPA